MVKGSHLTEEQKVQLSLAHMGQVAWNKGVPVTDKQKERLSAVQTGKKCPQRSHPQTLKTRAKISAAHWRGGAPAYWARSRAKRRVLGFNPLNSWFAGCDAHHINPTDVIHMPHKLHKSIYHNQHTGQGMAEINVLAGVFLTEDWT